MQPETILELQSPTCPLIAIVEQDQRVAYLYIYPTNENVQFEPRVCWLRNLQEAPQELEVEIMEQGTAPMLPKEFCKHPQGLPAFNSKDLQLIWLEEGDAVALTEKGELIAIIPSWSGFEGFRGYAKECIGNSNFATELNHSMDIVHRVKQANEFWKQWDDEPTPFSILQKECLAIYEEFFGTETGYYAIDNNNYPPRGMYFKQGEQKIIYATVAMSLHPMPIVELYFEDRLARNRIEIGYIGNAKIPEDMIRKIGENISGKAAVPWAHIAFLGEMHTANFDIGHPVMKNMLFTNKLSALPHINFDEYRGSQVEFLWAVPISEKERLSIEQIGQEVFLSKLEALGDAIFDLDRDEVV